MSRFALLIALLSTTSAHAQVPRDGVPLDPGDAAQWVLDLRRGGPFEAIRATLGSPLYIGSGWLSAARTPPRVEAPRPLGGLAGERLVAPLWARPAAGGCAGGPAGRVLLDRDEASGSIAVSWVDVPVGCGAATMAAVLTPRVGGGLRVEFVYEAAPEGVALGDQPRAGVVVGGVVVELFPDAEGQYDRGKQLVSRGSARVAGRWVFELDAGGGLVGDWDGDGIVDRDDEGAIDNCFDVENPRQENLDRELLGPGGDGLGDACDSDVDNDSVPDGRDNCPRALNVDQLDSDGDGIGDACEDADGDGVADRDDICPLTPDAAQLDLDGDGRGDVCDRDVDGDDPRWRVLVGSPPDLCPFLAEAVWRDDDGDGLGRGCDRDDAVRCKGWGCILQRDSDGDGVIDALDLCPTVAGDQRDADDDGVGDACDADDDDDGVLDRDEYAEEPMMRSPRLDLGAMPGAGW